MESYSYSNDEAVGRRSLLDLDRRPGSFRVSGSAPHSGGLLGGVVGDRNKTTSASASVSSVATSSASSASTASVVDAVCERAGTGTASARDDDGPTAGPTAPPRARRQQIVEVMGRDGEMMQVAIGAGGRIEPMIRRAAAEREGAVVGGGRERPNAAAHGDRASAYPRRRSLEYHPQSGVVPAASRSSRVVAEEESTNGGGGVGWGDDDFARALEPSATDSGGTTTTTTTRTMPPEGGEVHPRQEEAPPSFRHAPSRRTEGSRRTGVPSDVARAIHLSVLEESERLAAQEREAAELVRHHEEQLTREAMEASHLNELEEERKRLAEEEELRRVMELSMASLEVGSIGGGDDEEMERVLKESLAMAADAPPREEEEEDDDDDEEEEMIRRAMRISAQEEQQRSLNRLLDGYGD